MDSEGDVLLAGPAIRAAAGDADHLTLLCGPRGLQAAKLLPGVDSVLVHRAGWIDPQPGRFRSKPVRRLLLELASGDFEEAVILTSFHQSPLPLALLLRLAGVSRIGAISPDYPGSLLDVRVQVKEEMHEVERGLLLMRAMGHELPASDDGALRIEGVEQRIPAAQPFEPGTRYLVVHPGASVPARAWAPSRHAELVGALLDSGRNVVITGSDAERRLTSMVAKAGSTNGTGRGADDAGGVCGKAGGANGTRRGADAPTGAGQRTAAGHELAGRGWICDLGGATSLRSLAATIAHASAIVVGNTGPAHLAAAVGTPVLSLFAQTVPPSRWRPWRVPHELLSVQVPCAGCRARVCPVRGHPCIDSLPLSEVLSALARLESPDREAVAA